MPPPPTQPELLATMAEILFENGENMPEGAYLALMNIARDLSRQPPPRPPPQLVLPPADYKPIFWVKYPIKYSDSNDLGFHANYSIMEIMSEVPNQKVYYQITRVNVRSILVEKTTFTVEWTNDTMTECRLVRVMEGGLKRKLKHLKDLYVRDIGATTMFQKLHAFYRQSANIHSVIPADQLILWEFNRERLRRV